MPDYLPSMLTSDSSNSDGLSKLALLLSSLGAGMSAAGARNQPFYMGFAPAAAMFGNSLLERQQLDNSRAVRDFQLGLQDREMKLKEGQQALKIAGMRAAGDLFAPPAQTPGMRPDDTPRMGPPQNYYTQTADSESGGNYTVPNAKGSGAYGKYQFMPETWATVAKAHPELGLPFNMKQASPDQQEAAMRALTADNAQGLKTAGFDPTPDNLYLAHRFGVNGAGTMLRADPNTPIASLYPAQWTTQNPDMAGKTVGQFRGGVQQTYGGMPSPVTPVQGAPMPTLADVPKPSLPEADRARIQKLVMSGAITPEQGITEAGKIVNDLWSVQRQQAQTKFTQDSENWRFDRGQQAERERYEREKMIPKAVGTMVWDPRQGKLIDPVFGTEVGGPQVAQGDGPLNAPGDDNLPKTIDQVPPGMRTYVQGLVDGTLAAPSARQMMSPQWQKILEVTKSIEPSFDMTTYAQRQAQAKDFAANGKSGQALQSASNVVNHLVGWAEKYKALNNGDYRAINWLGNQAASQKGEGAIAAYTAQSKLLASEIAKLMKGGEPSEKEIADYQSMLGPSLSPQQAQDTAETILEMMKGRVGPIGETYERVMGRKWNGGQLLTPDAVTNLQKLYDNPIPGSSQAKAKAAAPAQGDGSTPGTPSVIRIDLSGKRQ